MVVVVSVGEGDGVGVGVVVGSDDRQIDSEIDNQSEKIENAMR